ncbi:helix-turn-helix domain-containing protein [Ilumatobacter sp.]|uniref:helix-turn-helix domain-containing protein n=1 Tax=Ilumatobacter sp. TaxID=1967498 RepID=UPI003750BC1A
MTNIAQSSIGAGGLLRNWRQRRRMSQLDLASSAQVSTRHLSYVETGRSTPSRELLLHLARHLDVPPREQNDLLLAAGYAPTFSELDLGDPAMRPVLTAIDAILTGSEPNPTLVMDRYWNLVRANAAALTRVDGIAPELLGPPLNVLRVTLHPDGLAPSVVNFDAVAAHLIHRLRRQHAISGDPVLADLLAEAEALAPSASDIHPLNAAAALELHLRRNGIDARYLSVVSTFGTALDITASELTIETFYTVG